MTTHAEIATWMILALTIITMVASAAWSVATIRQSARSLGRSLDELRVAVSHLDKRLVRVDERVDSQGTRLARLEGQQGLAG